MKIFALFICFYYTALTALPTFSVVKKHFADKCQKFTTERSAEKSASYPGCQKEKCLLNLTFNGSSFVVFNQDYVFKPFYNLSKQLQKSNYNENFISQYKVNIWQPPKISFQFS